MARVGALLVMLVLTAVMATAGSIVGTVKDSTTGNGLQGIRVTVKGTNIFVLTSGDGRFSLRNVPPGNHTLVASGPGWLPTTVAGVNVADDVVGTADIVMRSSNRNVNDVVVYAAARKNQKLTDAPAAVSVVTPLDVERATSHGSLGKTLEHLPGVDVVMSGSNDFNINTRGFNNSINRRTLVLIDGRDPSTPLINLNEWNSASALLNDVAGIEVVRGPGSALYGQNAYNGVVNIRTNAPRDVLGTRVSLTAGEYETYRASLRHAGASGALSYKINVGASHQLNYGLVPRVNTAEYSALDAALRGANAYDKKAISEAARRPFAVVGTARLDYDLAENETMTLEGGMTASGNEMYVNQTGRLLVQRVEKPFVRAAYNSEHVSVQALWQRRDIPDALPQLVYNAAARSLEASMTTGVDAQYNNTLLDGRLRYIVGAQYEYQDVSSPTDSAGIFKADMTLISPERVSAIFAGAYGQLEYKATDAITLVGALRVDGSRLFETQISPKLGIVVEPMAGQSFRLTLNRSFLRPSYTELFRRSPAGGPLNLAPIVQTIDSVLAARYGAGTQSNLPTASLSRFSVGNPDLTPESALSIELGYRGSLTDRLLFSAEAYYNQRSNLITLPLAGVTYDLYPAMQKTNSGNDAANAVGDSILRAQLGATTYNGLAIYEGKPAVVLSSTNVAVVNEYGMEASATYMLTNELSVTANYAYMDFVVSSNDVPFQQIVANTSQHRANLGVEYVMQNVFDVGLTARWVDGFPWLAGAFVGTVPTYTVVNLNAGVSLIDNLRLSVNVFNLLDNVHYEVFGGTLLRRQATATVTYTF